MSTPIETIVNYQDRPIFRVSTRTILRVSQDADSDEEDAGSCMQPNDQERWNYPKSNMWRILAAWFAFFTMGLGDCAPGALIPYFEEYYKVNYTGQSSRECHKSTMANSSSHFAHLSWSCIWLHDVRHAVANTAHTLWSARNWCDSSKLTHHWIHHLRSASSMGRDAITECFDEPEWRTF